MDRRRKISDEDLEEAQALLSAGKTLSYAAAMVGASRNGLAYALVPEARAKLQAARHRWFRKNHKAQTEAVPGWDRLTRSEQRAVNELCERLFPRDVLDEMES